MLRKMRVLPLRVVFPGLLLGLAALSAQTPGASRLTPNLAGGIDRPLRYRPDGADFVIEDGKETFNRPLYGGNSAFRVDGGDRPEFVLYLPGRGGNVRVGVATPAGAKWLIEAASIQTRYRPGELIYDIRDPLLGPDGRITLTAVAYRETEGLALSVAASGLPGPVDLVWAFGGVNGQRGTRDGDIGTEKVPISEWFQLKPAFCRGNVFELRDSGFTLRAKAATLVGVTSVPARQAVADAADWGSPAKLLRALEERPHSAAAPELPVVVGLLPLTQRRPVLLSFQRVTSGGAEELPVYREVTKPGTAQASAPKPGTLAPVFAPAELTSRFAAAEEQFSELRNRVRVQTPDPYLNAAVGALNVAADAVWDEPQQAIMHGAIAWRTKLLGWRGPYSLDALGRHDRARKNMLYWIGRQNTDTVPGSVPPADEAANLARNEAGLHSNGDLSNSHYDMNLVFFDGVFRHLRWTGDLKLARRLWPAIVRHLAWERRLFRREYGPEKLPLYEAYAAIWASDDLQYGGGGTAHASAYNYFQNREAARLARLLGENPEPYEREAELIGRAMRKLLWLPDRQCFAEYKDWLGLQRVHPSAALWTFYHTVDSEVPTGDEAWRMSRQVDDEIPHLPVRGPGVPDGFYTLSTSDWMPYQWSINNVVMSEVMHASLGFWQAGRPDEAWRMAKGSLLAAMYLGISPGNVGSMSYLDVYRRESQRDFADGCGTFSRALIEGLFGLRPDALSGVLTVSPGFPEAWPQASLVHPDVSFTFWREGDTDTYDVEQRFPVPQALRLIVNAPNDRVGDITINGVPGTFAEVPDAIGGPKIEIRAQPAGRHRVAIRWAGVPVARGSEPRPAAAGDGRLAWRAEPRVDARLPEPDFPRIQLGATDRCEPVDLSGAFNDRVTQIFRNEYRSPRSPFVSLALPKQGLGGWAGGVKTTAEIDDSGLRASAARGGGRISLPNGVPLATPGEPQARNVAFVSQWDNYPKSVSVELSGRARGIVLLMAGSTGPMQSRFENGEVVVRYADGSADRLSLQNPVTWWPIEQDYFVDDFQFRRPQPLPMRVDLKTGNVRVLSFPDFEGRGGPIPGGAATVLELPLQPDRELRSLEVRALANDVVIGLMSATLVR